MRYTLLLALFAAGCGSNVAGDSPATDAGVGDAAAVDSAPPTPSACPASAPINGDECVPGALSGAFCTYGDEIAPWCRTRVTCSSKTSKWVREHNGFCTSACPSTAPAAGTACSESMACAWADGTMCICPTAPTRSWRCEPPPADVRCPRIAPNLDSTCTTAGLSCRYTISRGCLDCSALGYTATCVEGVWREPSGFEGP